MARTHRNHSYTWLNSRLEPTEIPAHEYMSLMQRWVASKTDDPHLFPTDPEGVSYAPNPAAPTTLAADPDDWVGKRSGFPRELRGTCKAIFLQMFRVYAHLFSRHFVDPFYHLNLEKQLNSCFSHFLLTATSLDMLHADDLEPVQLLIDLWAADGTFPPGSKAYGLANLASGERIMAAA
ncbi:Mob1/phocein [Sporothrix brasiliensis 5110]|uniref:Mob1/phocein n=1 Tax=Sporothrix brasiliensis 5110 TaxID=1398154 RepID=A0A0C2FDV7_9PEZI|nr:Mob1/phocein [Sporothrix brasiliensis 5110]KIH89313.1 Mob1/phocein [Sporothrix brasiliensis 5110]